MTRITYLLNGIILGSNTFNYTIPSNYLYIIANKFRKVIEYDTIRIEYE